MPTKIYWTRQSREDLRAIREFIARDAPKTAAAYVRRLRQSVERLRQLPHSGQVVPELQREELREVIQGSYRIIYRVGDRRVDILAVYHAARLLEKSNFER